MEKRVERRLWLAVPHDARQATGVLVDGTPAIAWDREARLWYARMGCPLARIQAYLPKTVVSGGGDAQAEFHNALTQAGLLLDGVPVMDGQRHRVATVEDKKGRKSGVYRGFFDRRHRQGKILTDHQKWPKRPTTHLLARPRRRSMVFRWGRRVRLHPPPSQMRR